MSEENKDKNSDSEILRIAKERFDQAVEFEAENRLEALDDLEFRAGKQWPDDVLSQRKKHNRPHLVINKMPQFERQVTNEMRQNRPAIKVYPVDDQADIETAKIFSGVIRNIEYISDADVAYSTAGEGAVNKGFGFFRIITDYIDSKSFDQELLIKQIPNHFSVYLDPNHKEPDGSDSKFAFIFEDMLEDEYKRQFPDSEVSKMNDWRSEGDEDWLTEGMCRVAEYYYFDYKKIEIVMLEDGSIVEKSELPEDFDESLIKNTRTVQKPILKWCKFNSVEILEKQELPGSYIPVIPVYGSRLNVNGKWIRESLIRHAKDSQRMYNYYKSNEVEAIALAPKAPYIVEEGQIPKEYENIWKSANTDNHAVLPYRGVAVGGQMAPPPQRNAYEPAIGAVSASAIGATEDIKATTGIYDASLGNRSNESSGVAIARRNAQSQTSNFHFIDNLRKSIRHCGRILVELIPVYYDSARIQRIIGEDGSQELITINQQFEKSGQLVQYDFSVGKYDVTVDAGPSYQTKRQEAVEAMLEFSKAMPQQAQMISDLLVKNMDWPGAQEISERLKKLLPPQLIENKDQPQIPQQVQQQMQQAQQMINQLSQALEEKTEAERVKQAELESKERIEFAKMQNQLTIEMAKLEQKEALAAMQAEMSMIQRQLQALDIGQPITFNESGINEGAAIQQQQPTNGPQSLGQNNGVIP